MNYKMDRYNAFTNKNMINKNKKYSSSTTTFYFNEESFPTLKSDNQENINIQQDNSEIKKSISYLDKLNFITDEETTPDKYDLKPGWILITRDKNNKIITFKNEINKVEDNDLRSFSDKIKTDLKPMFDRWEKYKSDYIELYGEDDYYHNYTFPNYDYRYLNITDDETEECEYSDVDTDYQQSKNDYYDEIY